MKRMDKALQSVMSNHRQENYAGPLSSTSKGGHTGNVNNLYNSQVRNANIFMPYGISSRGMAGMKAQAVVNDNSESVIVGVYDPSRPQVGDGEICIYSSANASVYLSATGDISIETKAGSIDVKSSGMINITNTKKGSLNIDTAGNVGITTAAGYSIVVGLYTDDSGEGDEEEQIDGITIVAEDAKITIDGTNGEIKVSKEDTAAVVHITEEDDIKIVSQELVGVEVMHDENINVYNSVASVNIDETGKIDVKNNQATLTMGEDGKITIDTPQNVEFNCKEFKVNGVTVP